MLKRLFHIIFSVVTIFFATLLLLTYLSPYVNPKFIWLFSLLPIVYPFVVGVNSGLFLLSFFWGKRYLRYLLLLILIVGIPYHNKFFTLNNVDKDVIRNDDIKTLSYNVKVFDLYNWTHNAYSRQKMIRFIDSLQPDVACFQEYVLDDRNIVNTTDTLSELLHTDFIHEYFLRSNLYFHFGLATFSKYPVVLRKEIIFKNSWNFVLITDVVKDDDTLRIFNCHLQSNRFDRQEYNYLDSLSENLDKEHISEMKSVLKRLHEAFLKRAEQVVILSDSIRASPYPVIVCGDFNDVPGSYTYRKLMDDILSDSFLDSGKGFGVTSTKFIIPYRIDFVLYDDTYFNSVYARKYDIPYSDHFPYFTVLRKKCNYPRLSNGVQ